MYFCSNIYKVPEIRNQMELWLLIIKTCLQLKHTCNRMISKPLLINIGVYLGISFLIKFR